MSRSYFEEAREKSRKSLRRMSTKQIKDKYKDYNVFGKQDARNELKRRGVTLNKKRRTRYYNPYSFGSSFRF